MVSLVIETWRYFQSHDGRLLSGAIAFYASLAIAPLGVVALLITSLVMSETQARGELVKQLSAFLGPDLAKYVTNNIVQLGSEAVASVAVPVIGMLFMLYISARLFSMLRRALNHMWGIRPKLLSTASRSERFHLLRRRMLAFAMVLIFGSSLIALVLLHSAVSAAANLFGNSHYALTLAQFGSAFGVLLPLIALVYRWLPDAMIRWGDVWIGAAATCVFVLFGSFLIGIYMGYASPASVYGAAGSLIVLLLWIYYTAQIFLLGAVFTRVWVRRHGRAIEPLPYAEVVETRGYSASESASEM
ncbi:MAG: YihY/virulence factor BrkB family protein [Myxococcales bacterium]|jgi:membrane protein